jgi:hypothetical protein
MPTKNLPSICIPRVLPNITNVIVKEIFEKVLGEKCVFRVDLVRRPGAKSNEYQRAFIHFRYCPDNDNAKYILNRLNNGETVNIVYDEPWFWKCCISRIQKTSK